MKDTGVDTEDHPRLAVRLRFQEEPPSLSNTVQVPVKIESENPSKPSDRDCELVRFKNMNKLHSLTGSSSLVFFTPVMSTTSNHSLTNQASDYTDPFELLGRALSQHHRRIRHVPYVASIGFTGTHDAFLGQASAVVIMLCEPDESKVEVLANQVDFANYVLDALGRRTPGGSTDPDVILIRCGNTRADYWPDVSDFDTVLDCHTCDADAAKKIAFTIFNQTRSGRE